ncbi:hypothetical protein DLAC_01133 [Tieghemostelium lacteum]|uniref:Uncharacterized protein n=1 Tax=Tieghemostelium lacteum TaxID=361077 RepID=A0A152A842_TIELA|nr:hypothetical protein DLAC_01133 [Tieghemostelium lacteum]|eukprot:KYR02301.1 hypothetical protein DLAC_01133 [Tieghemostelium lacteum]
MSKSNHLQITNTLKNSNTDRQECTNDVNDSNKEFIPVFWQHTKQTLDVSSSIACNSPIKNSNNNSLDNYLLSSPSSSQQSSTLSSISTVSTLTLLKKYQNIFIEISQQLSTWNSNEKNLLVTCKSIIMVLERIQIISSSTSCDKSLSENRNSQQLNVDKNYFRIFKNQEINGSNEDYVFRELQLKHCEKLESLMKSLNSFMDGLKKVSEKLVSLRNDNYHLLEHNKKVINNNVGELNSGDYSTPPLTTIHDWFLFIVQSYRIEFQRKESILSNQFDYTKSQEQLYECLSSLNSKIDNEYIWELIVKVVDVIKES